MPSFGSSVRDLRRLAGLARPALAERLRAAGLRVPTAWIGRIERDEMGAALTEPLVCALADALGGNADAMWALARATMAGEAGGEAPAEAAHATDPFLRAFRQWLESNGYAVGLSTGAPAGLEVGDVGKRAADWIGALAGAALPMSITGGASAGEALEALVPFLPHCDLLAYRVVLGTPTVFPVIVGDDLTAEAMRQRLATLRGLAQPLAAYALGLNGQGGFASVTPHVVYFHDDAYESDDGARAVLQAGYARPNPLDAALREDRVMLQASVVNVPGGRLLTAGPPPDSAAARLQGSRLASWVRRGIASVGLDGVWADKTGTFTAEDLQTVLALSAHYASTP